MSLIPQALTGDLLTCTVASASRPGVCHTVYANRATGRSWCGPSCQARGEHEHTRQIAQLLADLADIRRNQEQMGDEMLSLQLQWLDPATVGAVTLAYLAAQDIRYSRARDAA